MTEHAKHAIIKAREPERREEEQEMIPYVFFCLPLCKRHRRLHKKLSARTTDKLFCALLVVILAICCFNAFKGM